MNAIIKPPLLPVTAEGIPLEMRQRARWAPWRAEWNPKANKGAGKYEKIPHRADRPQHGLSNQSIRGWTTFEQAMAVYRAHPDRFSGVGYLMTDQTDIIGIDLDHCRDAATGEVAPWALELAAKLDSYTEVSVSGTGLHVIVAGHVAEDWLNHDQGVEVYSGNIARFLAITGDRVPGTVDVVRPANMAVLDNMAARWRKKLTSAEIHDLRLPAVIPDELLPEVEDMDLPAHARNFLLEGPGPGDRSGQLFATAIAMAQLGLEREEVFSILATNDHALEVALDHRRQDYEKALRFLWKEAAQKGRARAEGLRQERFDEFPTLDEPAADEQATPAAAQVVDIAADFEDMGPDEQQEVAGLPVEEKRAEPRPAPAKAARFALIEPADFIKRKPASWIVRDFLPRAGLAVIYGASGSGKSFLTLDIGMCIVTGAPWRGKQVAKGRGVYIVAEGAAGFRSRLEAYCEFHGVDPADLDIRFITDAPNLMDKADIRELLISILSYGRVDFVVIDTYARAMAGANENDAKDVGQAVAHCDAIHRKTGALVILVHHSGKDASSGARGSSALRAAADVEIEVTKTRDYRAAMVTKMKDGAEGQEYQFKLAEVAIGEDEEGFPISSCVVEHRENAPAPRQANGKALTPLQKLVLETVDTASGLGDGGVFVEDLKHLVLERWPRDPSKKKDNRHRDIRSAIDFLTENDVLEQDAKGYVSRSESSNE